jgi:hypothetical protein
MKVKKVLKSLLKDSLQFTYHKNGCAYVSTAVFATGASCTCGLHEHLANITKILKEMNESKTKRSNNTTRD